MESFLYQVAQRIIRDHSADIDSTLVVFNNHRSQLFLHRAFQTISAHENTSFFLPHTTVIDDLVAQLGGLKIVPNEFLLFELYRIHEQIGGKDRKYTTFDEFISFGDIMLADFSEIDRYCADPRQLFDNLHSLKAIGEWDISNPHLSPFQQRYLDFYHSLYDYYNLLHQRLQARGEAYGGMAYRHVAEHIADLAPSLPYRHIYFVGFNALTECERRIIGEFQQLGIGHLLTDGDAYYYADTLQEAGLFLRRHSGQFPEVIPQGPSLFATTQKQITIVECPEAVLQCKYVGNLLAAHPEWLSDPESTAIVLADEHLLIPMLNALPESSTPYNVNISMGYAYSESNIHALALKIFALYQHASPKGYYHTDVVDLLSDPLLNRLSPTPLRRQQINAYLEKENRIRCLIADLKPLPNIDTFAFLLPDQPPTPDQAIDILQLTASRLLAANAVENNKKELQALGGLVEILTFLQHLQADYHYITSPLTLERIYSRLAKHHTIDFLGQPLSGLQIFGMLETRNLDFKRVILLSANEGVLPAARSQNTLIPYELQRAFHLPTYEEKDSIYAYNFYHLLQRTEEAYILFSSSIETLGKGEESRFLKQLRDELAPLHPDNIHISDTVVATDPHPHTPPPFSPFPHTPAIDRRLQHIASYGLSPSALSNYLRCPLRYYYANILAIQDSNTLNEELDDSQFGSYVHRTLQHIYAPFVGHALTVEGLSDALHSLPNTIQSVFANLYANGRNSEGRNHLLFSVAESQIRHLLQREINLLKKGDNIEIVGLEQELTCPLPLPDSDLQPNLHGFIDRIDRLNGQLRIIDYKTGSLDDKEIQLKDPSPEAAKMPAKWVQLMCYALLFHHHNPSLTPLQLCIYPLGQTQSDVHTAEWDSECDFTPDLLDQFADLLKPIVADLLNPELPFAATPSTNNCKYCPIADSCPALSPTSDDE